MHVHVSVTFVDTCQALVACMVCVWIQADEWLAPEMIERFGPFSECAKQHVAVKPQKGECSPVCNKLFARSAAETLACMVWPLTYLHTTTF